MTVPLDAQEILAQILSNQQQIDVYVKNNSLLVQQLLRAGIENSHVEYMRHNPHLLTYLASQGQPVNSPIAAQYPALEAPEPPAKNGRGRLKTTPENYSITPGTYPAQITDWALSHGGVFEIATFRDAHKKTLPKTYLQTGISSTCTKLSLRGLFTRLSTNLYRLNPDARAVVEYQTAKAASATIPTPAPVEAPAPPPVVKVVPASAAVGHHPPVKKATRKTAGPGKPTGLPSPETRLKILVDHAITTGGELRLREMRPRYATFGLPERYFKAHAFADMTEWIKAKIFRKTAPGVFKLLKG